ncbi:serine/threonine-protein kinase [Gordonia sp. 'Campus']|uniref:serine/threonine-protein kinase n=1 Tax=Gordonia sp. 'Campus' TaxID=2915824 RepID=UPI001EE49C4A|nr:serine/threonine-protein kinase [Gordonia sp. 'Campus']
MDGDLLDGRYELRGILGRGGMAVVHDGWDRTLHRPVAIKLLRLGSESAPTDQDRFAGEARAAAALNHPNIVAVYDYGDHGGTPYIVMERLSGATAQDLMAAGPLPPRQVRSLVDDVLAALAAAHAAGVLHRDVKPANLLVADDRVKVADLGIAKTAGMAHTATGDVVGTIGYLSPHRVLGRAATPADDLYAVAVVAYEALTGHRAYGQDNPAAVAYAILHAPPPPLVQIRPDLPSELRETIDRAMRPGQDDPPFPTAASMMAALRTPDPAAAIPPVVPSNSTDSRPTAAMTAPLATQANLAPPAGLQPMGNPSRPSRRTSLALLGGVVALLAVVLVAIALVTNSTGDDGPAPATDAPASTPAAESTLATTVPPPVTGVDTPAQIPQPTVEQPAPAPAGGGDDRGNPGRGGGNGNGGNGNGGNGNSGNGNGKPKPDKN